MKRSKTCRKHYIFGKPLQQGKGIKNAKCRIEVTSRGREKVDSERVMEGASKVPAMCYFFKWEVHTQMFLSDSFKSCMLYSFVWSMFSKNNFKKEKTQN